MDSRGIPIVVPGTPRRTPKNTPTRHEHHTSPYIINSIKNEKSLLEVYDSFADACFQSHFNHSMINEDYRYNIHSFFKTEMCPTDNIPISASLAPSPTAARRNISQLTFQSHAPEDMDFDDMRSDSNMLESISTTYSQVTLNLPKRKHSEEIMSIDDQPVGTRNSGSMEVDIEEVDSDMNVTIGLTVDTDTKKPAETEAQQFSSVIIDSNAEEVLDVPREKIGAVSPQKKTAQEITILSTQSNEKVSNEASRSVAEKATIALIENKQTELTPPESESRSVTAVNPNKELNTTDTNIPQENPNESNTEEIATQPPPPSVATYQSITRRLRSAAAAGSTLSATEALSNIPTVQAPRNLRSRTVGSKVSETVIAASAVSPKRVTRSKANTPDQSPTTRSKAAGQFILSPDIDLIEKRKSNRSKSKKEPADKPKKHDVEKAVKKADEKKEVSAMETMDVDMVQNEATASKTCMNQILAPKDDKKEMISGDTQDVETGKPSEKIFDEHSQKKVGESMHVEESDKKSEDWKRLQEQRRKRDEKEIGDILKKFPNLSNYYELVERAGRGTFSKVYKAKDLFVDYYMPLDQKYKLEKAVGGADSANYVAIKVIFDISSPRRVMDEISCLLKFRSSPCITPLIAAFRNEAYTYAVLPYIDFDHFDEFYLDMTMNDVRSYISQLLIGLRCVHAEHIMHRDVKPGNFLYNNTTKKGFLADFGLAQYVDIIHGPQHHAPPPNHQYMQAQEEVGHYIHDSRPSIMVNRSGTKGFRAPEVLMRFKNQTTAIDIWAVGVILLLILSGRYPFFEPDDDADGIMELAHVFGMKKLKEFTEYYGRKILTNIPTIPEDEIDLAELCQQLNEKNVERWDRDEYLQAIDLLKNCLQLIHTNRYTADEALKHPFLNHHTLI